VSTGALAVGAGCAVSDGPVIRRAGRARGARLVGGASIGIGLDALATVDELGGTRGSDETIGVATGAPLLAIATPTFPGAAAAGRAFPPETFPTIPIATALPTTTPSATASQTFGRRPSRFMVVSNEDSVRVSAFGSNRAGPAESNGSCGFSSTA